MSAMVASVKCADNEACSQVVPILREGLQSLVNAGRGSRAIDAGWARRQGLQACSWHLLHQDVSDSILNHVHCTAGKEE